MRSARQILITGSVALILGATAQAVVPDSSVRQYQDIPERNVFGLRPPPQLPPSNAPVHLPKITLTGITTILGNKRALMKVAPTGLKPGDATKELSMILTEGQREGDIEVLQIDENRGSVKVNNSGTEMLLTFEKDGAKLPASATTPAPPAPGMLPAAGLQPNPYPVRTALPGLSGRNPRSRNPGFAGAANSPVGGVPTATGTTSPPIQTVNDPNLTAEEQAIVIELQRQANASNPGFPPLPPTPITPNPSQPAESATPGSLPVPAGSRVLVPQ